MTRFYFNEAFGQSSYRESKIAILQLMEEDPSYRSRCPSAEWFKHMVYYNSLEMVKLFGIIPVINIIMGIIALMYGAFYAQNGGEFQPNHREMWMLRGVLMIFTGPLLLIIDMIKDSYYDSEINQFTLTHPVEMAHFEESGHDHRINRDCCCCCLPYNITIECIPRA